jgi:hypothetical protein
VNVNGGTGFIYDPPAINIAGTYYYTCITTDACGNTVISSPKEIIIVEDPAITIQPVTSSTVCPNDALTLTIVGSGGAPALEYQWYSSPSASTSNGSSILGATNSSYLVPTAVSGTYYYYCKVTASGGGCNLITSTISTVIVSPGIPVTPGSISGTQTQCPGIAGQTYSISAVTNATTYTWSVPAGWTITAGTGTVSITVTTGTVEQNGNISVTADNSCGASTTSTLAVISSPNTWLGTVNNNWSNASNWLCGVPDEITNVIVNSGVSNMPIVDIDASVLAECNNLTINSGVNLTIAPDKALTVHGSITNNSGNGGLVIQSDANGTGSLIHNANNVPATVNRYISGAAQSWHFLSSPVAEQSISGDWLPVGSYGTGNPLTGTGYDLYLWNEINSCWIYKNNTTSTYNWNNVHPNSFFNIGRGYLYSVEETSPVKQFIGNLNNSTYSVSLTTSGTVDTLIGFNLIGNPYPSSIDWQASLGWSRSLLTNSSSGYDMWVWNDAANNYGACNSATGVGTNSVTRYIPPMQGFFVLASTAGSLSLNNNVRVHNGASNWKSEVDESKNVSVVVNSIEGNGFDEVKLQFGNIQNENGAQKLFSKVASAPSLYLASADKLLSIVNLTNTEENPTVPLYFKAGRTGEYSIICNFDDSNFGTVMLEDKQTSFLQNMKTNNTYNFNSNVYDNANRFVLHFGPDENYNEKELPARIYSYSNQLMIDLSLISDETEVKVLNMLGQVIYKNNLKGESFNTIDFDIPTQILTVHLYSSKGEKIKKITLLHK